MTNWDEFKRLAEGATQGMWRTGEWMPKETVGRHQVVVDTEDGPYVILEGNQNFIEDAEKNAAFIAAANPKTILTLIAENERLSEELSACTESPGGCGYWREAARHREAERDQLRAEVEALRMMLNDAADEIGEWGAYASEYFQEKHDLAGCISKFKNASRKD